MRQQIVAPNLDGQPHACGGVFHIVTEPHDVNVAGSMVSVEQTFCRCDKCGEERQALSELGASRREAAARAREQNALLSPSEIRRIREERLSLTQAQLEAALGLGAKTVVRWETGRVLQPKTTDNLLRLLDRDPSALAFLAAHHGVELPPAASSCTDSANITEPATEMDEGHSVVLPRRLFDELAKLAEHEGVDVPAYLVWRITEQVTAARVGMEVRLLHSDFTRLTYALTAAWQPRSMAGFSAYEPTHGVLPTGESYAHVA